MSTDLIVVGGGIAGSAAALRAVQYHLRVVWLLGDQESAKRSRSHWIANIDNMIGIHPDIVTKKLLAKLSGEQHRAARESIQSQHLHIGTRDIIEDTIERVREYAEFIHIVEEQASHAHIEENEFVVEAADRRFRAPHLLLATGVMDRQPSIKKTKGDFVLDDPRWVYPFSNRETVLYCVRCEGHLTQDTACAVIGSTDAAAEVAMMLYERYASTCTVLTNGVDPEWSHASQSVLDVYGIKTRTERITDVEGKKGQLNRIELEDGSVVEVQFALVSMGLYRVYNEIARELGAELADPEAEEDRRHIRIDHRGETTIPNLFAVGDMARRADEGVMKQIYTCQEYAVRAVDAVDRRIRKRRRENALITVSRDSWLPAPRHG